MAEVAGATQVLEACDISYFEVLSVTGCLEFKNT